MVGLKSVIVKWSGHAEAVCYWELYEEGEVGITSNWLIFEYLTTSLNDTQLI